VACHCSLHQPFVRTARQLEPGPPASRVKTRTNTEPDVSCKMHATNKPRPARRKAVRDIIACASPCSLDCAASARSAAWGMCKRPGLPGTSLQHTYSHKVELSFMQTCRTRERGGIGGNVTSNQQPPPKDTKTGAATCWFYTKVGGIPGGTTWARAGACQGTAAPVETILAGAHQLEYLHLQFYNFLQTATEKKARQPEKNPGATANTAQRKGTPHKSKPNPKPSHMTLNRPKPPRPRVEQARASGSSQRPTSQRTRPTDARTRVHRFTERDGRKGPPAGNKTETCSYIYIYIYYSLPGFASRGRSGSLALPCAGATRPRARTSRRETLAGPRCAVLPGPRRK
jgi:hypothetical protein